MGDKPKTELELDELQKKWLEEKDEQAYKKMFEILVNYARSIILKMTRGKKFLSPDYVFNTSVDAVIKFFEQYQKNPQFKVDYSFAGTLRYKVLECLYGPKIQKQDTIGSINSYINSEGDIDELESLQEKLDMRPYWSSELDTNDPIYKIYHTEETTIATIFSVINDILKTSIEPRELLLLMLALLHTFRKSKNIDNFKMEYLDNKLSDIYEMALLEIRDRLAEEV